MADNDELEIYRAHRDTQTRQAYFLLGTAWAAIGFAAIQTQNSAMTWTHILLALAAVFWLLSFYCGVMRQEFVATGLYGNLDLLKVLSGRHPACGNDPENIRKVSAAMKDQLEKANEKTSTYSIWQFRWLLLGGITYIVWHATEMAIRTLFPST